VDILQEFGQDRHGSAGKVRISCRNFDRISTVQWGKCGYPAAAATG